MKWIPYVMVRITAFFAAGVLLGIHYPALSPPEVVTVFLTILATVYGIAHLALRRHTNGRLVAGILGLSFICVAGVAVVHHRDESKNPLALANRLDTVRAYRARILSPADQGEKRWRRTAEIISVKTAEGWKPCSGKLQLYWPLSDRAETLNYGDVVLVKGSPQPVTGPQNPGEFDYKTFLARRQIHFLHFIRTGEWTIDSKPTSHGLVYFAQEARRWTVNVIDRVVQGDRERAIIAAFVIGVTDGIDNELKQAYAAGGAMHALAVSGMHVSILYGVLLFLLKPLERRKGGLWITAAASLLVLWMYGFVTGLTPSVLRAVTMFSFVAAAKPLKRTTSILNTLAASAFVLLLFDPWLICSAGFQLSYLAVLGIVLWYRPLYQRVEMPWAWTDWVWQITCVSIAAQCATLPVTLYYFHQFPPWFLLANLFVIPASTLILLGGILLLIVSPLTWLAGWFARLLEVLVRLLNDGLFLVGELPSALISLIPLTLFQAVCMGIMMIAVHGLLRTRRFQWMWPVVVGAALFAVDGWRVNWDADDQFIVHRVARHASMEWQLGQRVVAVLDSGLQAAPGTLAFHVLPNRVARRIRNVDTRVLPPGRPAGLYIVKGIRFLWVGSPDFQPTGNLQTDYLIVGNNGVRSLESLSRTLTFGEVILDSSNSQAYDRRLVSEAKRMGIRCHSVLQQGAFVVPMNKTGSEASKLWQ